MAAAIQTTIKNTSGVPKYFAWVPPHGKAMAINEVYTFNGGFSDRLGRSRSRYLTNLNTALAAGYLDIVAGGVASPSDAATKGTSVTSMLELSGVEIRRQLIFTAVSVTMTDATTSGSYGSIALLTFPQGLVSIEGLVVNLTATAATGIGATGTLKHAVGSVAVTTSDTLSSTLANVVASTSRVLVASAGTLVGKSTTNVVLDGTTTAVTLYLNFGVADADSTANSTVVISGTVYVSATVMGDN